MHNTDATLASKIRQWLRDLFGSRLVEHLEEEKFRQQRVYEERLDERDREIARLQGEIARLTTKFDEYELDPSYFWWLAQRGRSTPTRSDSNSLSEVPAPKSWADIQREHYEREERELKESQNGVPDAGRNQELRVEVPG